VPDSDEHPVFVIPIFKFRETFVNSKHLTVNLRNAFEISSMLTIIRKHYEAFDPTGRVTPKVAWPQQEEGHFLRGNKPVIYLVKPNETHTVREILVQELEIFRGTDSCLRNRDIAMIFGDEEHPLSDKFAFLRSALESWNTTDDKITMLHTVEDVVSAEWAAVIFICRYVSDKCETEMKEFIRSNVFLPQLYTALSRARVYCTVVLFDYKPNIVR
jgi:hypothetical protein